MRKETKTPSTIKPVELAYYHRGRFESNKFFNSDRAILMDSNFRVSSENTASTLKIMKEGSEIGGFGIEWEMLVDSIKGTNENHIKKTVCANLLTMIFEKVFPNDLFKTEADCTVDIECVSQVMSKAFIRNNYKNFKACYDNFFPGFGISTGNTSCGMHVNISASLFGKDASERTKNARKLGYIINKNYNFFAVAFNRDRRATRWCPQMSTSKDVWKNNAVTSFPTSHSSCCYNWSHWSNGNGRVEIRLVGGQENYACFRNTMETIFFLMDKVKKMSWDDLDDLTKVFNGCNSYVFDRIKDNCLNAGVISSADVEKIRPTVVAVRFL